MKNKISITVIEDVSVEAKAISIGLKKKNLHSGEDAFEKKWAEGISGDELVKRVQSHINTLPWKK